MNSGSKFFIFSSGSIACHTSTFRSKKFFILSSGSKFFILHSSFFILSGNICAQDSLSTATSVTYDLTTETAVGTGSYTAYHLVTNRHHVLATRPNTAYMRGALNVEQTLRKNWKLTGTVDMIASVHADHKTYLQQCFANLSWKNFFLEAGSRELPPVLRNELLSVGHFAKGINAKPVPQVHIGTNGFWTVPYTKGWLRIHFDGGYGKLMDNKYREEAFINQPKATPPAANSPATNSPAVDGIPVDNTRYSNGAFYHQKNLYLRSNSDKPIYLTVGIEHVAFFGGTSWYRTKDGLVSKSKPANLKAFLQVILPLGDSNYFENDAMEDWVYGNHLGSMTAQLSWNIDKHHLLQVYLDNPFEDGSGIRKSNGFDGLWGIEYTNKSPEPQLVRGAVVEYFQSTNQSGPLHWDPNDYPEPIRSLVRDKATGDDNYYNHMFYGSYDHYGMAFGTALITSPVYNKNGSNSFDDNRVKAWHVAVNGEITNHLSYLVKGSYREGWGTYSFPVPTRNHSFDAMLQGIYQLGPWQFSGAYAFDKGNIYGDTSTFNIKIHYHGKIL